MSLFLVRNVDIEQWLALGRSWVEQEEELEGGRETGWREWGRLSDVRAGRWSWRAEWRS